MDRVVIIGRVWEYSGIRIYSGTYSSFSAPGSRIAGMEIQVFRNRKSSQTNANLHYSNYSYSGLIPNEHAHIKDNAIIIFTQFSELAELRKQIEEEIKASVSYLKKNSDLVSFSNSKFIN